MAHGDLHALLATGLHQQFMSFMGGQEARKRCWYKCMSSEPADAF